MSVHSPLSDANALPISSGGLQATELHCLQEQIRTQVGELRQQAADLKERLRDAERLAADRDRLRAQLEPLKQRIAEAARDASRATVDPDAHTQLLAERDRLVEEYDSLLDELDGEMEKGEALRRERDELREEKERLEGQVATLEADLKGWVAEAESLSKHLEGERQDVRELESLAEESMSQAERLQKFASEAERALEAERKRNEALQAQLVALANAPAVTASVHARGAADATETAHLIREIAKMVQRPPEPPSVIVAALRGLRQAVQELADQQGRLEALVSTRLGPESALGQVLPPPLAAPVGDSLTALPEERGGTPAEEPEAASPEETVAETELAEQASEESFARVELSWLAGRRAGDLHQRSHFLRIVEKLRRRTPQLRDDGALLQAIDTLQARFGDGFEYCLLEVALDEMHRPSLNVPLVVMKMHTIKHRRNWRRH